MIDDQRKNRLATLVDAVVFEARNTPIRFRVRGAYLQHLDHGMQRIARANRGSDDGSVHYTYTAPETNHTLTSDTNPRFLTMFMTCTASLMVREVSHACADAV